MGQCVVQTAACLLLLVVVVVVVQHSHTVDQNDKEIMLPEFKMGCIIAMLDFT